MNGRGAEACLLKGVKIPPVLVIDLGLNKV